MLSFPPLEAWDNQLQAVNFLALRNGKSVLCSITREVLERHFGPGAAVPDGVLPRAPG